MISTIRSSIGPPLAWSTEPNRACARSSTGIWSRLICGKFMMRSFVFGRPAPCRRAAGQGERDGSLREIK
jgi:hypothetical protein